VGEIDLLRLLGEHLNPATGILVALFEGLEGRDCLTTEAEVIGDCLPINLEGCASL
jgi:hypothetical protein